MKDIPVHQMKDKGFSTGIEIHHFVHGYKVPEDVEKMGAHRDDHYLFFMLENGYADMMVDFQKVSFTAKTLYYVLPGQVHHPIRNRIAEGWFVAADPLLIPPDYRDVFENQLAVQQPHILDDATIKQCRGILDVLHETYLQADDSPFHQPVLHALLHSFVGITAARYCAENQPGVQLSRPVQLSRQFKKLLIEHMRTVKSPSAYAGMLNVSESYLNEALKKTTGTAVSRWILEEITLEAKRLLYYSNLNVKEIAHNLGYEDHAYFSRLFKKTAGVTPLLFRNQYRK